MKAQEVRDMTKAEIENKLQDLKSNLFQIRTEDVTGRIDRPHRVRKLRKDIARCLTILKESSGE